MKCPYCDSEFDMQALVALDDELKSAQPDDMEWQSPDGEWHEGEADGLGVYSCSSCGGEIVADSDLGATKCPFCDNPVVLTSRFAGGLRPDIVIPFMIDKKRAVAGLSEHLLGKRLLPKVFKSENHIDEVKGVYVPFWLFDADVDAHTRYRATTSTSWSDSSYRYTKTDHYMVTRDGSLGFLNVPADGSSKIDDTLMESIEPFDLRAAVDFQTAYLAGYLANRYDVPAEERFPRANERVKQSTIGAFASTVRGYDSVAAEQAYIHVKQGIVRYALYPVWLLNTTWNGTRYTFAMNGQTGKFVGDLPEDKSETMKVRISTTAVSSAVIFMLLFLLWQFTGTDLMSAAAALFD